MSFGRVRQVHFIGIGGAGMCGLAELLHGEGLVVSGCDLAANEATTRLQQLGVQVAIGHDPSHLVGTQVVVVSSAIAGDHPEVVEATRRAIPVIRRAEMLGEISRLRRCLAIAGTHGKTTTTSLTGFILTEAGLDPTVAVGGRVHFLGAHARLGRGPHLVCEADEFDRSFLDLHPVVAVITCIEAEHLDTYGTVEALEDAFASFANRVPFYGAVIANLDDPGVRRLLPRLQRRVVTYGFSPQADVHARAVSLTTEGGHCQAVVGGREIGTLTIRLPGRHTVANALAALAAALEIEIDPSTALAALSAFTGVARRFERKGQRREVTVVDDYAHHATEVSATLQAARQAFPTSRLVAVFQPHLYSRTAAFANQLGESLLAAEVAVVLPIYPARESPMPGVTAELVVEAARRCGHRHILLADSFDEALAQLTGLLRSGDVLLTLGAGNVGQIGERWLAGGER